MIAPNYSKPHEADPSELFIGFCALCGGSLSHWLHEPSALEAGCVWCGATGYGKECPPCEVQHEGQPFPTEDIPTRALGKAPAQGARVRNPSREGRLMDDDWWNVLFIVCLLVVLEAAAKLLVGGIAAYAVYLSAQWLLAGLGLLFLLRLVWRSYRPKPVALPSTTEDDSGRGG